MAKSVVKVGSIDVDPEKTYRITLSKPVMFAGRWFNPTDRNIKVTGVALAEILQGAPEGAINNAEAV